MPEAVRLVIWDLDDTFWRGTFTEGGITQVAAHRDVVVSLARRGIMSAICSKNDHDAVREILEADGVWDYFVFPSINWEPKGERVARLIEATQLRPASVLFIDDNPMNLREALHFVPELQTADETIIAGLLDDPRCVGKDDGALTRLAQYKVLQRRADDGKRAGADNTGFLRASDIHIAFDYDVAAQVDRAVELINRTNQLNFTKSRLPEESEAARAEFLALIRRYDVKSAMVRVGDRYGDYGIVGIYVVQHNRLLHFCFSCRTLHMGVEDRVYDYLGRPSLKPQGEVLTDLFRDRAPIDWITLDASLIAGTRDDAAARLPAVRVRGACDLDAITHYLRPMTEDFVGEFFQIRHGRPIRLDHSLLMRLALQPPAAPEMAALAAIGHEPEDFVTRVYADPPARAVFIHSNWADGEVYVYRHRDLDLVVPFELPGHPRTDLITAPPDRLEPAMRTPRLREAFHSLRENFICEGLLSEDGIVANLKLVFDRLPPDALMFVLLSNETTDRPEGGIIVHERRARLNRATRRAAEGVAQARVIDVADFIVDRSEIETVSHFSRDVYHRLALHIAGAATAHFGAPPPTWADEPSAAPAAATHIAATPDMAAGGPAAPADHRRAANQRGTGTGRLRRFFGVKPSPMPMQAPSLGPTPRLAPAPPRR